MKNFVRFTASSLLIVVMLVLNILSAPFSTHVAASNIPNQKKQRENKVKGGPEVAVRVRQLKKSSKNVRAALKVFEDKMRMPKIG